eukprot:COSAG04_NODE_556_length_12658_cov_3.469862_5_plen_293_part_01
MPEHACNGLTSSDPNGCSGCANTGHKWLDFNRGDLVMEFNSPQQVATWDWQTANDAPARDPTKWTLEGSNDGDSWTVLDDTWATTAFATTAARYTWQGPFAVTNFCDGATGNDIPAGATRLGLGAPSQLVADTQIEYVNLPLDYEIGLDITPGPNIVGPWSSIVHFTATNTDCCDYGSRVPGVWFWPGTRKILVVDGHGANGNAHTGEWGCDDSILTLDEGTTYRLKMVMAAATVDIYVNGQLACTSTRSDRSAMEGVAVYMADPWYTAADAVTGNLYITGGDISPPPPSPPP